MQKGGQPPRMGGVLQVSLRVTRRGVAALPLAASLLAGTAHAQAAASYRWRDVKVGGGGFIPGIAFSPRKTTSETPSSTNTAWSRRLAK